MTSALQKDFEDFLSRSGLSSESQDTRAKLLVAYVANWSVLGKGSQIQKLILQRDAAVAELEEWRFTNKIDELQRLCDAKQAKIDALMLEFCPEEMTPEQMATWGASQRVVPKSHPVYRAIDQMLEERKQEVLDAVAYRWLRKQHEYSEDVEDVSKRWAVFKPVEGLLKPVECTPSELDRQIHAQIAKESK